MKNLCLTIFVLLICQISNKACAQKIIKDSVYYLIDTAKIPVNDRMIEMDIEKNLKYFQIKCGCLTYNLPPIFSCRVNDGVYIKKKDLKLFRFISLPKLIHLIQELDLSRKTKQYAFIFIEADGNKYIKRNVIPYFQKKPEIIN